MYPVSLSKAKTQVSLRLGGCGEKKTQKNTKGEQTGTFIVPQKQEHMDM